MTDSNSSAIGVFDSGVGGLSIAKCIATQLPNEKLVYVADSCYAPYGNKSTQVIIDRVNYICSFFQQQHCKAIVIACNTATVNAIDQLRQRIALPIIGVEPAIKPAAQLSNNKKVGLLVTEATAKNQRFLNLVSQYNHDTEVFIQPCPGLVELIEQSQLNSKECDELLTIYLNQLLTKGIDTLVLGCTHYPFLTEKIKNIAGESLTIVDTALPVTKQLSRQLEKHQLSAPINTKPSYQFYTSQNSPTLTKVMSSLWQSAIKTESLETLRSVDITAAFERCR